VDEVANVNQSIELPVFWSKSNAWAYGLRSKASGPSVTINRLALEMDI